MSNGFLVVAASGKVVGQVKDWDVKKLADAYKRLPEIERKPILEKDLGNPDPERMPPTRPPGALTFIIYNTSLDRNDRGDLVRARGLRAPGPGWPLQTPITLNDLLWLKREEWQALIPTQPKKGMTGRLPESALRRLAMFNGFDWYVNYQNNPRQFRSGELRWIVEDVSDTEIRTRIVGFSKVGGDAGATQSCSCKETSSCGHWGAELSYLGYVTIARSDSTIREFKLVALGETRTKFNRRKSSTDTEVNVVPTALVIELASDCPANNHGWHALAPVRMRHARINYWDPGK